MDKNFEGLKVLDFTRVLVGPYLTMMLADNGAEIVKIERPGVGADERGLAPIAEGINGRQSGYYMMLNRGKKSVVLDLKDPESKDIIYKLIEWADVLCENFAPGVIGKLGYGYDVAKKINPRIIYCSMSTFGQEGPLSKRPGYDIIGQAMSGLMWLTGEPDGSPMRSGTSIGDVNASAHALGAIGAALYYRNRTGKGQYIDICLRDCLTAVLETGVIRYTLSHGEDNPMRSGKYHATMMPYGVFDAGKGKYVIIVALQNNHWYSLCDLMGKTEWGKQEKFGDSLARARNQVELIGVIETWLQSFDDYMESINLMVEARVPAAPVYSIPEVLADEQYKMRKNIVKVVDPVFGPIEVPTTPMIFSETSVHNPVPAPTLGENTAEVLREIVNVPEEKIKNLMEKTGVHYSK